jgi:hypothetical protein
MNPRVFVSRPSILSGEQEANAAYWSRTLAALGFDPFRLASLPSSDSPWPELRTALEGADGAVVLGLRQLRVDVGCWRPGTNVSERPRTWWSTPWTQLEAGMAMMARVPTLVLKEPGVTEGAFESHVWTGGLYGADVRASPDDSSIMGWVGAVRARARARREADVLGNAREVVGTVTEVLWIETAPGGATSMPKSRWDNRGQLGKDRISGMRVAPKRKLLTKKAPPDDAGRPGRHERTQS